MKSLNRMQTLLMMTGGVMMVGGAAVNMWWPVVSAIVFGVGALAFGAMQALQQYEGTNFIVRRLRRQQMLGAVSFVVADVGMVMQAWHMGPLTSREWVLFLTIGCVLEFYTAIRIPQELAKESR